MAVQGHSALFCECKWHQAPVGADVLEMLMERGQMFRYESRYFIVFSKNGFKKEALQYRESQPHLELISFDEMVRNGSLT